MNLSEQKIKATKFLVIMTGIFAMLQLMPERAKAQVPSASFTSNVITGCAPLSVDFINLSTQASNYLWQFGNGNTSSLLDPTTVYLTPGQYTVTLIAINALTGDADTLVATNYINVVDDPVVDFVATPLMGCAGNNSISFTNLSTNATSYIWDFGDGNFSTLTDPTHSYSSPGFYTVKLIARNNFNCSKIEIKPAYIEIVPDIVASFTVNQQSSCNTGTNFNFTSTTPGATSWFWDFGNGVTSNAPNPSYVYGAMGSYDVTLIVTNANGCIDTLVKPAYINIGPNLVPSFTVTNQAGCFPLSTLFTCTVPGAISWAWDLGDGSTSTQQSFSHVYPNPGSYDITLSVITTSGCNGSVTLPGYITVDDYPTASFTLNNPVGCKPHSVTFNNTSTGGATYSWNFGNGNTSTAFNPVNIYSSPGTFNVSLITTSPNGCTDSSVVTSAVTVNSINASFSATPRAGCAPLTVNFSSAAPGVVATTWDFGDGTTGTGLNVNHTYPIVGNYNIQAVITSSTGCSDTIIKPAYVRINSGTVPYTVPDTILVCTPPGAVSFTDPTISSTTWLWNFGDGDSSTIKNPSHSYLIPGIYTVTLTTSMPGGCGQTFNPYAIINVLPFIVSPITSVIVSPCGPYNVQFNNGTVNVASYLWDFGDGTTSTLANPSHTYALPGTYNITLQLTSVNGCLVSLSASVTVGHVTPISVSDDDACQGDTLNFNLNPASAFVSALWDFGDGNSSALMQPSHIYNSSGSFTVTATLTDTAGCVNNYTYSPVLISNPLPSFTVNQSTTGCAPFVVPFTNTSSGALSYLWDFGNSTTSTLTSPSNTYSVAGTYSVTLQATANGCVRSITIPNYISVASALANFSFTPTSGCLPVTVNFTDLSVAPVSWLWDFGDGNTSTLQNPVHTYTVAPTSSVTLTITDTSGCTKTRYKTPVAIVLPQISVSDSSGCRPFNVNFSSSTVANSYLWDFGDGSTSTLQNPSHLYSNAGLYTVTLTCVLASGCTTTTIKPGFIEVIAPVSEFMSPTQAVCAPSLVNFINQSTGATMWHWDFGDGTSSSNENPSHIYNVPGTYTVSLISFTAEGCSDTLIKPDYILVPGTLSNYTITSQSTCLQTIAQFIDQSINASNWFWNFGDGFTSTLQNPTHTYVTTGSFTVTLITTDSVGCSSFYSSPNPVIVHPDPVAAGSVTIKNGCNPLTTSFANTSTGAVSNIWYFGNGDSSTVANPTYTYTTPGVYQPYIVAITAFGCTDTFYLNTSVVVYSTPNASFNSNVTNGCSPLTVNFNNQTTPLDNPVYNWSFGTGATSALADPTYTYNNHGTYAVQMIVTNLGGCADTATATIVVDPSPVAIAQADVTTGCSPLTVNFSEASTDAVSYIWNFGDGSTSTSQTPSHTYTTGGSYTVTLIVTSATGCTDTLVFGTPISVDQTPNASFTRSPVFGCEPLSVLFNSTSSLLNNPLYSWDFGDGTSSTLAAPSHVYTAVGTFNVVLIVTNDGGCNDTVVRPVIVHPKPDAIASASVMTGCSPLAVTFTNNSLDATTYTWDFGDGTTSTASNPSHTYTTAGSYQVMLIASNANGCIDTLVFSNPIVVNQTPNANFSRTPVSGCTPVLVSFTNTSNQVSNPVYAWDFGNGQTSSLASPTFNYTIAGNYQVMLVVTNDAGCTDTVIKSVTVNETPVAAASMGTTQGCSPVTVSFTNNSIGANTYSWNFGNGGTSALSDPSYTYTTPGVYTVSMIATSAAGCSDTVTLALPVSVYQVPVANFTRTPASGCSPVNVVFNNTSSSMVSATYEWDFGNGQTSTSQNPTMTFVNPGTYPVQLIVTNLGGCSDTIVKNVTVYDVAIASATVSDTVGCTPFNAIFTNSSTGATSYSWDFGDGSVSTGVNPSHTYTTAGIYTVTLIATNANNCADTLVFPNSIHVNQSPVANFSRTPTSGCSPLTVVFNNASQQQQSPAYFWDFGNGQTGTATTDTVLYVNAGVYQPTLIVTNSNGCTDTVSKSVTVNLTPEAIASANGTSGCAPYAVTFTNTSQHATTYNWNFGDGSTGTNANPSHTYAVAGDYTVTLIATGAGGCKDTLILTPQIHVKATPSAAFTSNVTAGCMPLTVNFNDMSTGLVGAQYAWVFGNGQSSSQQNPVATFTAAGTYTVQLVVTNDEGCSDTTSSTIVVDPLPVAQATMSNALGCSPLVTTFTNISTGAGSYTWFFGDNTTSLAASPSHTYTAGGNYTVSLVAMNQFGCSDTFTFPNQVIVNQTPVATFTHTGLSGCTPLNISFTSTSTLLNAPVYTWDFGNGQTAATANASASYNSGGTYPVSFIVTNAAGCADTATATVTAYDQPVAIASTVDTVGCAPHNVTFANNSLNGTGYLWNFGDGTTSTLQTPSHTYSIAGNYIVTLIVTGAGNCADTLVLNYPIHIKAQPIASFGPASITGCTPLTINFTNLSTGLVGPSFNWEFGTGAGSSVKDPSYTYTVGGTFGVVLTVTNSEGCSDTATASVTANLTPIAQAGNIDPDGCAPHAINFSNSSLFADTITWNFGDGTTSGLNQIVHNYAVAGTYFPYLIASSTAGCADTFFFATPVQVNPVPVAAFTVNQTASCSGTTFQFMSQSTPTTGLTYSWNIAGMPYSTQNPAVPIMAPGFYNASLIVTNQFGCSDTMDQPNYIQVYDTLPPGATPILSVSVVNNTSVEITWQNSSALDLGAYVLYRLNNVSGVYDQIYRDNSPNNSSMSVTSTYVDQGLATLQNVYTYKLQTLDQCEYTLPLSASIPHTTMNVTAVPQNDDIRVTWTKYFGCNVSTYEVNRVNLADGTSQLIATVPPNTTSYLDQGFYCPDEYSYRITATSLCGNAYISLSDTSVAVPANPLADQKVDVVRSTVINDKDVLTEWLPPVLAPNRVLQYNVLRSADNISFVEIANLPASALSYIDYDTDVHQQEYYYRIDVVSDCEIAGALSNNSSSILLKSDWQNEKTKLWWTKYTNWDTGVDYYIIEQENSFGQWDPVKTVDGNETQTTLDE
ncbi:MAG: PKD domain-containing protein [Bacteroidetes bacterium]|nr:PKD domain-containing protein [Bacteroidota bacterium]